MSEHYFSLVVLNIEIVWFLIFFLCLTTGDDHNTFLLFFFFFEYFNNQGRNSIIYFWMNEITLCAHNCPHKSTPRFPPWFGAKPHF